jgi:hypothetical protein
MKAERHTVDFVVDGVSLFAATGAGELDMCARLSPDYARSGNEPARAAPNAATSRAAPSPSDFPGPRHRTMLDFAYENGYVEAQTDFDSYSAIGPFEFAIDAYRTAIMTAASAPTGLEPTAASACDCGRNPADGG